jgi:hypothetical protein
MTTAGHTLVAAHDLYWALLDPRPLGRAEIAPQERGFLFEAELPVPIEEVHAVYAPLPDGRVLACGIGLAELESMIAERALSATPEALPDWLPQEVRDSVAPKSMELLHGPFEPQAVRRARRTFVLAASAVTLCCLAALLAGVVARGRALERAAAAADEQRDQLVRAALAGAPKRPGLPDDLRLTAELRELRGTRSQVAPVATDVAPALAGALGAWPAGAAAQLNSITVGPGTISFRGAASTQLELQRLMDAVAEIPGWRVSPAQFRVASDGVAFGFEATIEAPAKAGGGVR